MFRENKNLIIIALIAVVNALGYGIIIPILYTYSQKYGLTDFQNGLLFSAFSIAQFIATPIIGRLSDVYGRKPLLILSMLGTAASFFIMAWAPNAAFLFLARVLDGITAGNVPVASAVISDTTRPEDRARGFGIIGASFGFGFIFGPAISALTIGYGLSVPFIIAGAVSLMAVVLTAIFLPETNVHKKQAAHGRLIDISKLLRALTDENVGVTLIIAFLFSLAFSLYIYGYQPFSVKILGLNASQIALNFMLFGIVGLIAQAVIIPKVTRRFGEKPMLRNSLFGAVTTFLGLFFARSEVMFMAASMAHSLANAFVNPLLQSLLSKEADEKSQGSIQGLYTAYVSVGMIVGPVIGGALATYLIPAPFLLGSALAFVCAILSFEVVRKSRLRPVSSF